MNYQLAVLCFVWSYFFLHWVIFQLMIVYALLERLVGSLSYQRINPLGSLWFLVITFTIGYWLFFNVFYPLNLLT